MKKVIFIMISILIFILIFWFSSKDSSDSSEQSDNVIVNLKIMTYEEMKEDPGKANIYRFILRKVAHFSLYATLGIFIYIAIIEFDFNKFKTIYLSLVIVIIASMIDEFHQSFVSGRSMEIRDVCIDFIGALIGILIIKIKLNIERKKVYFYGK